MPSATTAAGRPRALLLVAALLNLLPPVSHALALSLGMGTEQFRLVAGTGALAAMLCTLYALCLASLRPSIRLVLGCVAVSAAMLFLGGDAVGRALPAGGIGPGLLHLLGVLLHLSAAVTLFTLGLVHHRRSSAAPTR